MKPDKQLDEWVKGNPIHNTEQDECCPDFSCCTGKIASKELREKFAEAYYSGNEKLKMEMLGMFLGMALSNEMPEKNIYIGGLEPQIQQ